MIPRADDGNDLSCLVYVGTLSGCSTAAGRAVAAAVLLAGAPSLGLGSDWAGDARAPIVMLRQMQPGPEWAVRGLPKIALDLVASSRRIAFTAEHEAELMLANDADEHETRLYVDLRDVSGGATAWQPFVRAAVVADGDLRSSLSSFDTAEAAVGLRHAFQHARVSGTLVMRLAYRDRDDRADLVLGALKLKCKWPLNRTWQLDTETMLSVVQLPGAPLRTSANLRLFVLHGIFGRGTLQAGGMLYLDGVMEGGTDAFRIGIGPAIAAIW